MHPGVSFFRICAIYPILSAVYAGCVRTSNFDKPYTDVTLQANVRGFVVPGKGRGSITDKDGNEITTAFCFGGENLRISPFTN